MAGRFNGVEINPVKARSQFVCLALPREYRSEQPVQVNIVERSERVRGPAVAIAWGLVVTTLSLLCWGGQLLSFFAPEVAARFGLIEDEDEVDPVFRVDARGEALWDIFTLWSMVLAGVLLVAGHDAWAYFGLVGGGAYLYFAGRGIITRRAMQRRELRIGAPQNIRLGYALLATWGTVALMTCVAAAASLAP